MLIRGALLLALAAAALGTPVRAQRAAAARGRGPSAAVSEMERRESATCDLCHGDREVLRHSAPRGWNPDSLYVTPQMLEGGAHAAVPCVRCHPLPGTLPHPDEPRSAVPCGTCHAQADSLWRAGPHGGRAGRREASCVACHGSHDMLRARDLESPAGLRQLSARCVSCHTDRPLPEGDVHRNRVNCASCHGAHMIQPVHDSTTHGVPLGIAERCAACHDSVATLARTDIHGISAREMAMGRRPLGGDSAATCIACHGGHGMPPAHQLEREVRLVSRCAACHREEGETYGDTYHGRATRVGYYRAARCDDCHSAHRIFPSSDRRSATSQGQLAHTCGRCHEAASRPAFVAFHAHVKPHTLAEGPAIFGAWLLMNVLLFSVFAVFGMQTVFWLRRLLQLRWEEQRRRKALGLPPKQQRVPLDSADRGEGPYVWRFKLVHRLIHGVSVVSFFALIITGLPLRFSCAAWAPQLMGLLGGAGVAGTIHRAAGGITVLYFTAHLVHLVIIFFRTKDKKSLFWGPDSMVVQPQDLRDFAQMWKWFFNRAPYPRFARYAYNEKFHYIGAFWGIVLLGGSGLVRWFPGVATVVLPGWAFNVAAIFHSEEALLAAGFMFVIHFFNVHMRPDKFPMDGAMFTGRLRLEELAKDHALTAEAIGSLEGHPVSRRAVPDLAAPPPPRWMTIVAAVFGLGALAVGLVIVGMILWVQMC